MSLSRRSMVRRATVGWIAMLGAAILPKSLRARAQDDIFGDYELICTEDGVRIRSEPSLSAAVRATVNSGDRVSLTGVSVEADGYRWMPVTIRTGGEELTGWTTTTYFRRPDGELGWLPGTVVHVNTTRVNLHAGAGINYTIVGNFNTGTNAIVNDGPRNADGYSWYNITIDNVTGWMVQDYLTQGPYTSNSMDTPAIAATSDSTYLGGITVAASNSPAWMKAAADYVCDGTSDNVEWQAAIDDAQSHPADRKPAIFVLPGDYHWSAGITTGAASIIGVGGGTKPANVFWNGPNFTVTPMNAVEVGNRSYWEMSGIYFRPGPGGTQPDVWINCYGYGAIDVFFRLTHIQLQGANVQIKTGVWFNFHMSNMRFDSWHVAAVQLNAYDYANFHTTSLGSFVLDKFTADNNIASTPGPVGTSVVELNLTDNNVGVGHVTMSNGRVEFNSAPPPGFGVVRIVRRGSIPAGTHATLLHVHDVSSYVGTPTNFSFVYRDSADISVRDVVLLEAVQMNAGAIFAGMWWSNITRISLGAATMIGRLLVGQHDILADAEVRMYSKYLNVDTDTSRVHGDTTARFAKDASGRMKWGNGSMAHDVTLYRGAADRLKTDDDFDTARHFRSSGNAPTIAAWTGAGTTPTVRIAGTDVRGTITVTTGSKPSASAVVATVTFNVTYGNAPGVIILQPSNEAAAVLSGAATVFENKANRSATAFVIRVGSMPLAGTTTYLWDYLVMG